ncbi:MAG: lytic murein transglycosylase [Desulfobulbus sp.]|jgi:membrane-bound lytic murein transglycosylase B|uniref:lytic murein transglycosylase n=1 Tax=Desulfobulbus sp. TaxID=895 RepID=UPI002847DD47|nr:lytic murein transglycosylase [Desulfobulbus sp.]MDR2549724.1 lytic murein transglycosylase [Desulfobulbus sp.]
MPCPIPAGQPPGFRPIFLFALALIGLLLAAIPDTPRAAEPPPLAADLVEDGQSIDLAQEKYRQLFDELTQKYQFRDDELQAIFQGLTINRKILVLMDKQGEAKPYYSYAPIFVTPGNIKTGKEKLQQYQALLDRIEATFGVNREVIVAIWGVETRYGIRQGNYDMLQTLNTLFAAYPRRSDFYRKQLIDFLLLCRENGIDPHGIKGSSAGAFGQTQFIPTSFRSYAVSFDGDAKRDVWNSVPDVLASIANYLKRANWVLDTPLYADLGYRLNDPQLIAAVDKGRSARLALDLVRQSQNLELPPSPQDRPVTIISLDLEPGGPYPKRYVAGYPNFQAITAWNRSNRYAMVICELAEAFGR